MAEPRSRRALKRDKQAELRSRSSGREGDVCGCTEPGTSAKVPNNQPTQEARQLTGSAVSLVTLGPLPPPTPWDPVRPQ